MKGIEEIGSNIIEEKIHSIGINLTLMDSIVKFLDFGLNSEFDADKIDIINLTVVLKRLIKLIKNEYENLENLLNV